jgi:hypothetical protein
MSGVWWLLLGIVLGALGGGVVVWWTFKDVYR